MGNDYRKAIQEDNMQQNGEEEFQDSNYGYTGNPFADLDYNLCKRCRRKQIDRTENPNSELCRDCREELIKLRIPPYFFVIGVVVICMMLFTFLTSIKGFEKLESYTSAESLADDGYVITAMENLLDVLEENPDNKDVAIRVADIGVKYGYYDYAAYAIDSFLVGKSVSDGQYNKLNGYIKQIDTYYDTLELNDEVWEEVYAFVEDENDIEAIFSDYNREMSQYIGNKAYDQALLYYYLAYMSLDEDERNSYFVECIKTDPHYYDAYAQIANSYRRRGDFKTARKWVDDAYKINKEDYSVLRAIATLELVEGNLEKGLDFASQAFDIYPEGEYVIDTYIVALAANGKEEEARQLTEEYEEDYIFDDDLYAFLDGKMTLEEYYVGE